MTCCEGPKKEKAGKNKRKKKRPLYIALIVMFVVNSNTIFILSTISIVSQKVIDLYHII